MAKKNKRNPLNKRYLREFKHDLGKYIVIFALMIITIGLCSGFKIADDSIMKAYNESFDKYNVEDGNLTLNKPLTDEEKKEIEKQKVTLYKQFYYEEKLDNETKVRIFEDRQQVNKICLMKGKMPSKPYEIAIDRMHADNNDYSLGDKLKNQQGQEYTITGFVALPDYSCLYEKNTDSMFDSIGFGVGIVSSEMFEQYDKDLLTYTYSWKYDSQPKDDLEAKDMGEDLLENLVKVAIPENFVPRYMNQAINFAGDDMGKDGVMIQVLCYMLIVLLAFIFAITSKHTIEKEANVIGTLRASGFTRMELVRHYLTLPVIVSLISSLVGNIMGYTFFKDFCADMYYGSYSLTTYVTIWNGEAFIMTTVIPLICMVVINVIVLYTNLKKPIQKFLRGDLSNSKNKKCIRLNHKIKIFRRFKLRVILQNIPSIILIFIGAVFANLILMFGLAMPTIISEFSDNLEENMFAKYQYTLSIPVATDFESTPEEEMAMAAYSKMVTTKNKDAEAFSAYSLQTKDDAPIVEEVLIYGVQENSRYVDIDHKADGVFVSSAFADKYNLEKGDEISLTEKFENKDYSFKVAGVFDYNGAIAMFADIDWLNEFFDMGKGTYVGYFSDSEIKDIEEKYIASVTDYDALNKIARQLNVSIGSLTTMIDVFAVIIFVVVVYLLSKIIIERNAHSISVTRILGYNNGEIGSIYISSISIAVILSFLASLPIVYYSLIAIYESMICSMMPGWLPINVGQAIFGKMILMCIGAYVIVAILEYRKVKRIPMDIALKTVE